MRLPKKVLRLRFRNTYANIASTVSLFLVLTTGTAYAVNTITGADVVDGTLTGADIGDGTVGVADVGTDAVAYNELQFDAVSSRHIRDGQVSGADIATGAIGQNKLQHNSVTSAHLVDGQVNSSDIANAAIRTEDVASSFKAPDASMLGGLGADAFQRDVLWAYIEGTLSWSPPLKRGHGAVASRRLGTGHYSVTFNQSLLHCGLSATETKNPYIINVRPVVTPEDSDFPIEYRSMVEVTITDPASQQRKDGNAYIAVYC